MSIYKETKIKLNIPTLDLRGPNTNAEKHAKIYKKFEMPVVYNKFEYVI